MRLETEFLRTLTNYSRENSIDKLKRSPYLTMRRLRHRHSDSKRLLHSNNLKNGHCINTDTDTSHPRISPLLHVLFCRLKIHSKSNAMRRRQIIENVLATNLKLAAQSSIHLQPPPPP